MRKEAMQLPRGRKRWLIAALLSLLVSALGLPAHAQQKKPNILIIWGDDIGQFNISAYNHGMMGYKTPNIDSIAKDGALFTDWYGQQSCTAGRDQQVHRPPSDLRLRQLRRRP